MSRPALGRLSRVLVRCALGPAATALLALLALLAIAAHAPAAWAQIPPGCAELCGTSCVKPFCIPDRWDDVTPIPGHDGTITGLPDWHLNARYDLEPFTDTNGNGLHDPGEPFTDQNRNGVFDREAYDPLTTGYVADPVAGNALAPGGDLGQALTFYYDNGSAIPVATNVQIIDLPPLNKGVPLTGSGPFGENLVGCNASTVEPGDNLQTEIGGMAGPANQGLRSLIAQDPEAYWDPLTQSVHGSAFLLSPRVLLVPVYDPTVFPSPGRASVVARKIIPVFIERMTGSSAFQGRLLRLAVTGSACSAASAGAWLYACPTPATPATWGRLKATYR